MFLSTPFVVQIKTNAFLVGAFVQVLGLKSRFPVISISSSKKGVFFSEIQQPNNILSGFRYRGLIHVANYFTKRSSCLRLGTSFLYYVIHGNCQFNSSQHKKFRCFDKNLEDTEDVDAKFRYSGLLMPT